MCYDGDHDGDLMSEGEREGEERDNYCSCTSSFGTVNFTEGAFSTFLSGLESCGSTFAGFS